MFPLADQKSLKIAVTGADVSALIEEFENKVKNSLVVDYEPLAQPVHLQLAGECCDTDVAYADCVVDDAVRVASLLLPAACAELVFRRRAPPPGGRKLGQGVSVPDSWTEPQIVVCRIGVSPSCAAAWRREIRAGSFCSRFMN
jgi:hypothetical protein